MFSGTCVTSAVGETSSVSEFIICLNCHCQVQWHVLSKPWKELLEVTRWGEAQGKAEHGASRAVIPRAGGVLGQLPGFAKHSRGSGMFLFQAVVPGWRSSKCGTPKTFNGVGLILAFGTASFSDHEAAQALSLTWLLPLFLFQISLLIFDYCIIFSRTL